MVKRKKLNLGKLFAEMIYTSKLKGRRGNWHGLSESQFLEETLLSSQPMVKNWQPISQWKLLPFYLSIILFLTIFVGKLVKLQIIYGAYNMALADGNRIQVRTINAPRGIIYDRNGKVMAKNLPAFRLIKGDDVQLIDRDTALDLESQNLANETLSGGPLGRLEVDVLREYPYGESSAHLLGFISQISADELREPAFRDYNIGDSLGRQGVEESYESYLRGKDGRELIEVDAVGNKLRVLTNLDAKAGNNLVLTVDAELEKVIYEALSEGIKTNKNSRGGAAVAIDPQTGGLLALVSYPSYDNNLLTHQISQEEYQKLSQNSSKPFLNRAIAGIYPPGSIFKIVSAIAGLKFGAIKEDTRIEDVGEFYLGDQRFPNWYFIQYGRKEGLINLVEAIARSNDIFFYRIGEMVGVKVLAEVAEKLGLGKKTGIDLPNESIGLVPTPEWKEKVKGEVWFPGNTLHMAIGQGDVLATPLQLANLTAFVANGGILYKPFVVSKVVTSDNQLIFENKPQIVVDKIANQKSISLVREGMHKACLSGGTGWPFFDSVAKIGVEVGCKTGTAEIGVSDSHAWFTVFAPFESPKIVLTVLVENGGEGSSVAGPIAKEILEWYFKQPGNS